MRSLIKPALRARLDRGASAVEYGLLVTGIAAVVAVAVFAFGHRVVDLFTETCAAVTSAASQARC